MFVKGQKQEKTYLCRRFYIRFFFVPIYFEGCYKNNELHEFLNSDVKNEEFV